MSGEVEKSEPLTQAEKDSLVINFAKDVRRITDELIALAMKRTQEINCTGTQRFLIYSRVALLFFNLHFQVAVKSAEELIGDKK